MWAAQLSIILCCLVYFTPPFSSNHLGKPCIRHTEGCLGQFIGCIGLQFIVDSRSFCTECVFHYAFTAGANPGFSKRGGAWKSNSTMIAAFWRSKVAGHRGPDMNCLVNFVSPSFSSFFYPVYYFLWGGLKGEYTPPRPLDPSWILHKLMPDRVWIQKNDMSLCNILNCIPLQHSHQ